MENRLAGSLQRCIESEIVQKLGLDKVAVAVSVVSGEATIYQSFFGASDGASDTTVDEKTIFPISSLTKAFTALAYFILSERTQFDLDRPINETLDFLPLSDVQVTKNITVSDILSHNTGVPSNDLLWMKTDFDANDLLMRLRYLELLPDGFRKSFSYNNLMYGCLNPLFFEIEGQKFTEYVFQNILQPLGMGNTFFAASGDARLVKNKFGDSWKPFHRLRSILSAGGLYSNIKDLENWLKFLLMENSSSGKKLLLQSHRVAQISTPRNRMPDANSLLYRGTEWIKGEKHYGLGWMVGTVCGQKILFHPGFIDDCSALALVLPDCDIAAIVIATASLSQIPGEIGRYVCENVLGKVVSGPISASTPSPENEVKKQWVVKDIERYCGVFENQAYGRLEVWAKDNRVYLKYFSDDWPIEFNTERDAMFYLGAMGLNLPFPIMFGLDSKRCDEMRIPFSMDPRIKPQVFVRKN